MESRKAQAVRRPHGASVGSVTVFGDLLQPAAVRSDDPDFEISAPIRKKCDTPAIRRESWQSVFIYIVRKLLFTRTVGLHDIDVFLVTPRLKGHPLSVGRNIGNGDGGRNFCDDLRFPKRFSGGGIEANSLNILRCRLLDIRQLSAVAGKTGLGPLCQSSSGGNRFGRPRLPGGVFVYGNPPEIDYSVAIAGEIEVPAIRRPNRIPA